MHRTSFIKPALAAIALFTAGTTAHALLYDQNIRPAVIFGSGNANGSWTVDSQFDVELGLRAKLRFDGSGSPQNIFNSNGDGTYTFAAGAAVGGASWVTSTTPVWNFEWAINTRVDNPFEPDLNDFSYRLDIDFNPLAATTFLSFDPINVPYADHALGDNTTGNGGGVSAISPADYVSKISTLNVAQNSWNMEFFDTPTSGFVFDPSAGGTYTFVLTALDGDQQVASTSIDVIVRVPDGGTTIALLGLAMAGLAFIGRRRRA